MNLSDHIVPNCGKVSPVTIDVKCIICDEAVLESDCYLAYVPMVCDNCKRAIRHIRKQTDVLKG